MSGKPTLSSASRKGPKTSPPGVRALRARFRSALGSLGLAGLVLALGCGEAGPPQASRSVACTLQWTGPADLDLTVDGQSAARVGGSPDMTHGGGTEAITIPETDARETVVMGVANRSAEPGGSGEIQGFATLTFVRHDGSTVTMERSMDSAPWTAAIVHPATGIVIPAP